MTDFRRVLITGSRSWDDAILVQDTLEGMLRRNGSITVVHGDCPTGADRIARNWARGEIIDGMHNADAVVRHESYPADWGRFGKQAGPIRNRYMVQLGADICIAFPTAESRGTISCMDLARAAGIPVLNLGWQPDA